MLGVPVMVVLLILGPVLLLEQRDSGAGTIDLASVALSSTAWCLFREDPFFWHAKALSS